MTRIKNLKSHLLLLVALFSLSANIFAQSEGEQIFKSTGCTACHTIGGGKLVGPDLQGVLDRRSEDEIIKYVQNPADFGVTLMPPQALDADEIKAVLAYISSYVPEVKETTEEVVSKQEEGMSAIKKLLLAALILIVIIFTLTSVKNALKATLDQPTESVLESVNNFCKAFLANFPAVVAVVFIGFIIVLKIVFDAMMGIGVTTNYQPEQPIAYSHKIHAGDNGIDCNYCHSGARNSKTAGIPSANVCMNCHTYISSGTNTGETEIAKIYDAIGFDVNTRSYIEGYEQKPIKWVRIHNLPDLSYFNHSQHVTVGKLECQECHGAVEEMDVVWQENDLTMGWCIDCHRETEVKMEGNDYYTSMHEKMKEKYAGEKITVDKIGGLECGKCHY
ncbi:MAG: cytochrome c3 family protein [Flavobacteriales bacterium]|jgi:cytochrome c2/Flp pilus assembly pilin Flp|nr:cytochrome c3 family protein [Flavobacteriales bacterium]HJN64298.1 cytochrome c3 family protein [Flavobacteriales bacterium]